MLFDIATASDELEVERGIDRVTGEEVLLDSR